MTQPGPTLGIIANPASGRDLRRLTSSAGLHSSTDKASAIQRLLAAFGATGVAKVLLPVLKASQGPGASLQHWPAVEILDLPLTQTVADTHLAVRRMRERGVDLIAVLGGDGTHKAVAAHVGDIPLLTLSTGTNNAFPQLREATSRSGGLAPAFRRRPRPQPARGSRRNLRLLRRAPCHRFVGPVRVVAAGEPRGAAGQLGAPEPRCRAGADRAAGPWPAARLRHQRQRHAEPGHSAASAPACRHPGARRRARDRIRRPRHPDHHPRPARPVDRRGRGRAGRGARSPVSSTCMPARKRRQPGSWRTCATATASRPPTAATAIASPRASMCTA